MARHHEAVAWCAWQLWHAPATATRFAFTQRYADEGRVWFEALVGASVTFVKRKVQEIGDVMAKAQKQGAMASSRNGKLSSASAPELDAATVTQLMSKVIHDSYAGWADEPIPAIVEDAARLRRRFYSAGSIQHGRNPRSHFFHHIVRRLLNQGQSALRRVNHPELVNQNHALRLRAGSHQTDRQTHVACAHAALRDGAHANHAQPVQIRVRHHNAGPASLLLLAQCGVETGDYDVAALPNLAAQRGTSWPTAGMLSQALSITSGSQGSYLLDFYHVCEYLGAAAALIAGGAPARAAWMEEQKDRLKTQKASKVLQALQPHLEPPDVADGDAPARQCHRYLSHRADQLNYQSALARGLPIGSGEIESAHRYVVQKRLQLPGAWWRAANAEHMLALRLNRANRQWSAYWAADSKQAA